jgi:LPPG:FO 2-phospho-L-lactate transferase
MGPVVVLAGGTGAAKLARGMLDVVGADELVVIANTGDDVELYGAHVSPDVDLVGFWLADRIDERGWGLAGDTFNTMDGLRELGVEVWFQLGDRDLALGLERARALERGERATEVDARLLARLGVAARVLPMSDQPVRTRVLADGSWSALQSFLIERGARGPIQEVHFRGAGTARATPEALAAIAAARAVLIGPSNPVISIGPILAVRELRAAIAAGPAPVVAVSPFVGGRVLKGPTAEFVRWRGLEPGGACLVSLYEGLLDGIVADDLDGSPAARRRPAGPPAGGPRAGRPAVLARELLLDTPARRRTVAAAALEFAISLQGPHTG